MAKIFLVLDKADRSIVDAFESRDDALKFCHVRPTDVEYVISDLWVQPKIRVTPTRDHGPYFHFLFEERNG